MAFLLHELNQLAKRKQKENIKKKESCKSPDKSIESFSVDFVRLSALNLISAKFIEAMENSLEVQAKAVCCKFLVKTFVDLLWDALKSKNESLKKLRKEIVSEFNNICETQIREFVEFVEFWERNRIKCPSVPVRTTREC